MAPIAGNHINATDFDNFAKCAKIQFTSESQAFEGNTRGPNSIDFQFKRTLDSQIPNGTGSLLVGENNTINGDNSICTGLNNDINGSQNLICGNGNIGSGSNSVISGQSNVFDSFNNGIISGYGITTTGSYNIINGVNSYVNGSYNLSIGENHSQGISAASSYNLSVGYGNYIQDAYNCAIGYQNLTINGSTAIGRNCYASASYSTAIGKGAVTSVPGQFSLANFDPNTDTGQRQNTTVLLYNSTFNPDQSYYELTVGGSTGTSDNRIRLKKDFTGAGTYAMEVAYLKITGVLVGRNDVSPSHFYCFEQNYLIYKVDNSVASILAVTSSAAGTLGGGPLVHSLSEVTSSTDSYLIYKVKSTTTDSNGNYKIHAKAEMINVWTS